jgi:hypothetical protein
MTHEKTLLYGYTDAEAAEILKRQSPEYKAQQEEFNQKEESRRWQRWMRKVKGQEEERVAQELAAAEAIAQMSPAEFVAWERKRQSIPTPYPKFPKLYILAAEDIRVEERKQANRDREAAEAKAGIPEMQRASAARLEAISAKRRAALAELDQQRRTVLETARADEKA